MSSPSIHSSEVTKEEQEYMVKLIENINWVNPEPRKYLVRAVELFGLPDIFAPQKGGMAIWSSRVLKGTPFVRLELRDEAVVSHKPRDCIGFWYTSVSFEIIEKCSGDVGSIADCIMYDRQQKIMTSRQGSQEENIAILMIATAVGNCFVKPSTINKNGKLLEALQKSEKYKIEFLEQLKVNLKHPLGTPVIEQRIVIPKEDFEI